MKLTSKQKDIMESFFSVERYPTRKRQIKLAAEIGVHFTRVRYWFQNKRARQRAEEQIDFAAMVLMSFHT